MASDYHQDRGGKMKSRIECVRKLAVTLVAASLVTASVVAVEAPAFAAASQKHCTAKVGTATSQPGKLVCFSKFADAISYVTSGSVKLPQDATSVTEEQLQQGYEKSRAAAPNIVIGISYANTSYQGNTFVHYAATGCDDDGGREYYHQFNSEWNDETSSARGYSRCTGRYWEIGETGTSGDGAGILTDWSGGAMNDKATFVEWL